MLPFGWTLRMPMHPISSLSFVPILKWLQYILVKIRGKSYAKIETNPMPCWLFHQCNIHGDI